MKFLRTTFILKDLGISRWVLENMEDPPPRIRLVPGKNAPWLYPEVPFKEWKARRFSQFAIPAE